MGRPKFSDDFKHDTVHQIVERVCGPASSVVFGAHDVSLPSHPSQRV